jgi:hypothetical protein
MKRAGLALAACALLAACNETPTASAPRAEAALQAAQVPPGAQRVSGAEYRRLVFGNSLERRMASGAEMLIFVDSNGRQSLRIRGVDGRDGRDSGTVALQGDAVCSRWSRIDAGRQTCFAYFLFEGALVAVDLAGELQPTRFELRPGNPGSL